MGPLGIVALLLAAAATTAGAYEPVSLEDACRRAASTHIAVDTDHCVGTLSSDPRSEDAGDLHGLALLATRISAEHAVGSEARLASLSHHASSRRDRFDHCLTQYGGAGDLLRDAVDSVHARAYATAAEQIAAALNASRTCDEDAWVWEGEEQLDARQLKNLREKGEALAAQHQEYGRMANIAIGFVYHANPVQSTA